MKPSIPDNSIPVVTYAELSSFANEFKAGAYDLMGIIGERGLGKSWAFREVLPKDEYCLVSGAQNSGFQVYQQLLDNVDLPVVFDDADTFWLDPKARPLLKQLCETDPKRGPRLVTYRSREIERMGLDTSFYTTSRVAVVCNHWPKGFDAVADRGIMLRFCPIVSEVHQHIAAAPWFGDAEVLAFMEQHLHLITAPSMRYYINSHLMRQAGRPDWQEKTLLMIQPDKERQQIIALVSALLKDEGLPPPVKVKRFKAATGLSQPTFYRVAAEITQAQGRLEGSKNDENLRKPGVPVTEPDSLVRIDIQPGHDDDRPTVNDADHQDHVREAVEYFCGEEGHGADEAGAAVSQDVEQHDVQSAEKGAQR